MRCSFLFQLHRIAKGLKTKAPVKDEKEIPELLQELDKDARSLDKADDSYGKGATVKAVKMTGEFYGELDKGEKHNKKQQL